MGRFRPVCHFDARGTACRATIRVLQLVSLVRLPGTRNCAEEKSAGGMVQNGPESDTQPEFSKTTCPLSRPLALRIAARRTNGRFLEAKAQRRTTRPMPALGRLHRWLSAGVVRCWAAENGRFEPKAGKFSTPSLWMCGIPALFSSRPKCMYRLLFANDFWHVLGSRSYVSGLLIDTRDVALLEFSLADRSIAEATSSPS